MTSVRRNETEDIKGNEEYFAELFSEENPKMKETLLNIWNHGFETVGCCTSHENQPSPQYIGFKLNDDLNKIKNFLSAINKEDIRISFVCGTSKKDASICNKIFSVRKYKTTEIYPLINDALTKKVTLDKTISDIVNYLYNNEFKYTNIHLIYNNNKISLIKIYTVDEELINILSEKYEKKLLNEKRQFYQFLIK